MPQGMVEMVKIDINNVKGFHEWIKDTFNWVDNDAKKYMFRSWCARGKIERRKRKNSRERKEVI